MGKVTKTSDVADLEDEDYFEEFDFGVGQEGEKMETDQKDDDEEIFGEAEKWDDDDIEEDFATILKAELKISEKADDFDIDVITKQEIATREAKRLKKKQRKEAMCVKELQLLKQEKLLEQRKKVYIAYTLDAVTVTEEKKANRRKGKNKDKEKEEVQNYFKDLITGSDLPTPEASKEEFLNDLKSIVRKDKGIPMSMQRENLSDKDKELKRKEKYLAAQHERFLKHRRNQVAKLLSATAAEDEVKTREEKETIKAIGVRQNKRRLASLVIGQDKAQNMTDVTKEDMDKIVLHHAQEVAFCEGIEERELFGSDTTKVKSKSKKCLPYKAVAGDIIDVGVGEALAADKFNCGFALNKDAGKFEKFANTREYVLEDNSIVRVKLVHKVVLATATDDNTWTPLVRFLHARLGR